jgi:hypothetical protein
MSAKTLDETTIAVIAAQVSAQANDRWWAIQALGVQLQQAQQQAYLAAYGRDAHRFFQTRAPTPNTPGASGIPGDTSPNDAAQDAAGIANTLQKKAETWLTLYLLAHVGEPTHTVLQQARGAFRQEMHTVRNIHTDMIENVTVQRGADQGHRAFASDIQNRQLLTDAGKTPIEDVLSQLPLADDFEFAQRLEDMYVAVFPPYAKGEDCEPFAGEYFGLSDAQDLPRFPRHPNCPHEIEYVFY